LKVDNRMGTAADETNGPDIPSRRRFMPPGPGASTDVVLAWRNRFDPVNHNEDQQKVADMLAWAWNAYETNAFGQDYLDVNKMRGNGLPGHDMALTLVDSLDTLFIVGMFEEFDRASAWVSTSFHDRIYKLEYISLFETTIRVLGGLLSAYYLSGHVPLLTEADALGEALLPAFTIHRHGMPPKDIDVVVCRCLCKKSQRSLCNNAFPL
jgi:Glycosyl hydrolase family 47